MPLVQSNRRQIARTNRFCHPRSLIFLKTTIRIPIIQKSRSLVIIFIPLLFFVFLLASIQDNGMLLQKSRCLFYRTRNVRLLLFHTTLLLTRYFIGLNVCAQSVWWTRPLKIRSPFASFRPCLRPFVSVTKKKMEKKRGERREARDACKAVNKSMDKRVVACMPVLGCQAHKKFIDAFSAITESARCIYWVLSKLGELVSFNSQISNGNISMEEAEEEF